MANAREKVSLAGGSKAVGPTYDCQSEAVRLIILRVGTPITYCILQ